MLIQSPPNKDVSSQLECECVYIVYNCSSISLLGHMHHHMTAYVVGLICTYIALAFMKTAQPALLYLVPTTLLSVTLMTLIRREFVLFFTGKPRVSRLQLQTIL